MSSFNKYNVHSFKADHSITYTHQQLDDAVRSFIKEGGKIKRIETADPHPESRNFLACRTQAAPHQFNLHPIG